MMHLLILAYIACTASVAMSEPSAAKCNTTQCVFSVLHPKDMSNSTALAGSVSFSET